VRVFFRIRHQSDPFSSVLIVSRSIDGFELNQKHNNKFCDFDIVTFFQELTAPGGTIRALKTLVSKTFLPCANAVAKFLNLSKNFSCADFPKRTRSVGDDRSRSPASGSRTALARSAILRGTCFLAPRFGGFHLVWSFFYVPGLTETLRNSLQMCFC
jgi:hypothetical protein